MNKGKKWLKKMLEDRIHNLSRIMCDKIFFEAKLEELGGRAYEEKLRGRLAEMTKKQSEDEKKKKAPDAELMTRIKETNTRIDTIASIADQYEACDAKIAEFKRYIIAMRKLMKDPQEVQKFNNLYKGHELL